MINTDELKQILNRDYFSVLGIPTSFDLDISALAVIYRAKQKTYHPDNGTQLDSSLQTLILSASAHINNAFTHLKNPLTRAMLLLELNGSPLDLTQDTTLSHEFLLEQMEFHEEMDDALQAKNLARLEELEKSLQDKEYSLVKQLSEAFKQQQHDQARELTKKLAFYHRVLSQVNNTISTLW